MKISNDKMSVSRLKKCFIGVIIVSMTSMLAGCYLPKAIDDFSVMGNDTLSDLVRNSYGDGNLTPGYSSGVSGVGRISKSKIEFLASNLFAKQERNKIEATFVKMVVIVLKASYQEMQYVVLSESGN
ncbi:hypothetical protein IV454_00050 [Massilia antarctica]|uniref:Uncharacterized protein n=1 Tax=Massilia antarctica TaxID=2765360 RepID=A0AA48WCV9_9BURK|nr:hypothetical protein [Massilia antarctica]QPI50048.1 hypothetical protein IV454_32420 [Massilia antarctica]QPI50079.1 hypothetical protein IV454_00050 [Massilia antarctica]